MNTTVVVLRRLMVTQVIKWRQEYTATTILATEVVAMTIVVFVITIVVVPMTYDHERDDGYDRVEDDDDNDDWCGNNDDRSVIMYCDESEDEYIQLIITDTSSGPTYSKRP